MEELMEMLECIEDNRQQSKVRYPIKEIVLISSLFGKISRRCGRKGILSDKQHQLAQQ